ncbi:hypothetical protein DSECCO2_581080 [anaerobic digester metagenome]
MVGVGEDQEGTPGTGESDGFVEVKPCRQGLRDPESEQVALSRRYLGARDHGHGGFALQGVAGAFHRVVIGDRDGIEADCLRSPEDFFHTALSVPGVPGMDMQIAPQHEIRLFGTR